MKIDTKKKEKKTTRTRDVKLSSNKEDNKNRETATKTQTDKELVLLSTCQLKIMFSPSLESVEIAIRLLDKYKFDGESVDDVLKSGYKYLSPEDFLREHFARGGYSEETQDSVAELFFKILKYRKYLAVIVKEMVTWKNPRASENFSDYSLCLVFMYFLVFELRQETKDKIREMLMSINERRAFTVLTFLASSNMLRKLYEWGCRIWDVEYVKKVLENIIKEPSLFEEVYGEINKHLEDVKRRKIKQLTVPVGPKFLTRYKNKTEPPPPPPPPPPTIYESSSTVVTRIPVSIQANRAPSTTYTKPIELEKIEAARLEHREQGRKLFEEAQRKAFRCANPDKSEKYKELVEKLEGEKIGIPIRKTSSMKNSLLYSKPKRVPKKTAAVILREGARLLKLEQEQIKRYEDLANGGFNGDLVAEWEEELREEKFREHLEHIEKKHLEGLLSYEEALLAKQRLLKKRKEMADEFRKEKENWTKQLEMWRNEEQRRIQESVEKGKASEKGAKEAVEQVREEKHKLALETMEESKSLKERWLKEKEEDLQRKVQLIKEIKALQALGVIKKKQTDFSETGNLGFLCEMSIAELKERLFLLRIEIREELERKRSEIKMKKEFRKEVLDSYQELIENHRKVTEEQRKSSKLEEESKEREKNKKRELRRSSSCLDDLRRKLYEKRRERLQHQILA